jgi:hypothetical protein
MSNTQNTQANTELFTSIDDSKASTVSGGGLFGTIGKIALKAAPAVFSAINDTINN